MNQDDRNLPRTRLKLGYRQAIRFDGAPSDAREEPVGTHVHVFSCLVLCPQEEHMPPSPGCPLREGKSSSCWRSGSPFHSRLANGFQDQAPLRPREAFVVACPVNAGGSSAQSIPVNLPVDMCLKTHSRV